MREYSVRGRFWLPGTPDVQVGGILEFKSNVGGKLSLIGDLAGSRFAQNNPEAPPRIVGELTSGRYVTLENCFQTQWIMGGTGLGEQTYHVGIIFDGVGYEVGELPEFNRIAIELRHFFAWTGLDGLSRKITDDTDRSTLDIHVKSLPMQAVEIEPGVVMKLYHRYGLSGKYDVRTLRQVISVHFEFDAARAYLELSDYATSVQDLVSIATGRSAEFDSFSLFHPKIGITDVSGEVVRSTPVTLDVEWIVQEKSDKAVHTNAVPVPFSAIGGAEGIGVWLRKSRDFRGEMRRVMNTRYATTMYVDDRFFNRVAALESLHRRISKGGRQIHFIDRLRALTRWAGDPFRGIVGDTEAWVLKVKGERNDHAHHLGNAAQTTGAVRYYLADSAYWLFVICIFRYCGYPDAAFEAIEKCDSVSWLRERIGLAL